MEEYIEILKVILLTVATFAVMIATASLLVLLIKEIKDK